MTSLRQQAELYYKVSETKRQLVKDTDSAEPVFSGYDMNKAGKQTVTVKYKKYSTSFEIEVKGKGEAKDPFLLRLHSLKHLHIQGSVLNLRLQ